METPVSPDRGLPKTPPPVPSGSRQATVSPTKSQYQHYDDVDGIYDSDPEDDGPKFEIEDQFIAPEQEKLTIRELHSMIHEGAIYLNPPYQREVVWPAQKQALLIDSLFRNFYIPPVVFAVTQDEDGVPIRVCVDGKQRLTSIQRFLDGQVPYVQSKKQHWYYTRPDSAKKQKLQLPDHIKSDFDSKKIVCVEYRELTPSMEREIFQRVQMGMPLTTAEKLAAIDSPWAIWIALIEDNYMTNDGGLAEVLNFDNKRGREFQNIANFLYCCDGYPEENIPTSQKMSKWLARVDTPTETFKQDIEQTLTDLRTIAGRQELKMAFTNISQRIAPVEFVFIGVLLYILRNASFTERAQAIYSLRTQIRERFLDIKFNSRVGAAMWDIIRQLKHNPAGSVISATPKRKRRTSQGSDDEYRPSPMRSFGRTPKTRSKRE